MRKRQSCSCCSSNASVVQALQRENEKLTAALTEQTATVAGLLRKAMDCALTQPERQFDRLLAEQDTERARAQAEPAPPRPMTYRPEDYQDEPGTVSVRMPSSGGGMGM